MFALVHIGIAVPLIVWLEARNWPYLSNRGCIPDPPPAAVLQEDEAGWDPCAMTHSPPAQLEIVWLINPPAAIVAGWQVPCPSKYSLAGVVEAACGSRPRRKSEIIVSLGLTTLIFLQWLVAGALPLLGLKPQWHEPFILITLCAVVGALAFAFTHMKVLGALPALIALVVWLVWFVWLGVVLLKAAKARWTRLVVRA